MVSRFASVFHATYDLAWKTLRRLGVPEAHADDAAQEVFLVVAKKLDAIEPGRERSFVFGTARRVASDHRRAQARRPQTESDDALDARWDPGSSPEDLAVAQEQRAAVERAFGEMTSEEREVFLLSEIEGLSKSEVARTLGIAEGTVASRLRRARRAIGGASPMVILGWWKQKWCLAQIALGLVFASAVALLVVPRAHAHAHAHAHAQAHAHAHAQAGAQGDTHAKAEAKEEPVPVQALPVAPREDALAAEVRTIQRARAAIARNDTDEATRALDAYDRLPGKTLAPEAAALRDQL